MKIIFCFFVIWYHFPLIQTVAGVASVAGVAGVAVVAGVAIVAGVAGVAGVADVASKNRFTDGPIEAGVSGAAGVVCTGIISKLYFLTI